ncbi:hypothetical protein EBU24_02875 [bacterium]|nr:hypothetical protein [bacterium]
MTTFLFYGFYQFFLFAFVYNYGETNLAITLVTADGSHSTTLFKLQRTGASACHTELYATYGMTSGSFCFCNLTIINKNYKVNAFGM